MAFLSSLGIRRLRAILALSLDFLARHEHVLSVGPVGVEKPFPALAIGYAVARAGHSVRFIRADA